MKIYLPLLVFSLLLFSCKKDEAPVEVDYSHYVGNFYGEKTNTTQFGQHESSNTSDRVVLTRVENGKLKYSNTNFDIESPNTTNFSYFANDYSHTATASFYNNFNDFSYSGSTNMGGGAGGTESYSGVRTQIPLTNGSEHPIKSQLEGQFILSIHKFEYLNGIDLTYIDTLDVQMSGYSAVLDNTSFGSGRFYSYLNDESINPDNDVRITHNIYWVEDSIYINQETVYGIFGGAPDTLQYTYSGARL